MLVFKGPIKSNKTNGSCYGQDCEKTEETEAQGLAQVLELNSECCVEHIKTDRKVHRNKVCVTAGNLKRMKYQHKIQNSMHKTYTHPNQTKTHHEGGKVGTTSHLYPRSYSLK